MNKINGIDISECEYINCCSKKAKCIILQDDILSDSQYCESEPNCYFKQLKRLEQENKEKINILEQIINILYPNANDDELYDIAFNSEYIDKLKELTKSNECLQEENKKLKEVTKEAIIEHENLLINRNDFAERATKLEQENKELKAEIDRQKETIIYLQNYDICHKTLIQYEQALEEILKILCNGKTFYEGYFDSPILNKTDKAIKVIKEVLDEN